MKFAFFQVDAFADQPLSGNPAALLVLDRWLDEEALLAIAAENNLSDTAYVMPSLSEDADYELRWSTPVTEIALCGHVTMASAHVLMSGSKVRFSTKSGVLAVTAKGDLLELELPAYSLTPGILPGPHEALGVTGDAYLSEGGNRAAIVILDDEPAVRRLRPDLAALRSIDRFAIVTAPGGGQSVVSRVFSSYFGNDEDLSPARLTALSHRFRHIARAASNSPRGKQASAVGYLPVGWLMIECSWQENAGL